MLEAGPFNAEKPYMDSKLADLPRVRAGATSGGRACMAEQPRKLLCIELIPVVSSLRMVRRE